MALPKIQSNLKKDDDLKDSIKISLPIITENIKLFISRLSESADIKSAGMIKPSGKTDVEKEKDNDSISAKDSLKISLENITKNIKLPIGGLIESIKKKFIQNEFVIDKQLEIDGLKKQQLEEQEKLKIELESKGFDPKLIEEKLNELIEVQKQSIDKLEKEKKTSVDKKEESLFRRAASGFYSKGIGVLEGIKKGITGLGDKFKSNMEDLNGEELILGFGSLLLLLRTRLKDFFENIFNSFRAINILQKIPGLGRLNRLFISLNKVIPKILGTIGRLLRFIPVLGKILGPLSRVIGRIFPFSAIIMSTIDFIRGFFKGFTETEGNIFKKMLVGIKEGLIGLVTGLINVFLDLPKTFIAFLLEKLGFQNISDALRSFSFAEVWETGFRSIVDFLSRLGKNILDLLTGKISFKELGNSILEPIKTIFGMIRTAISNILDSVKNIINDIVDKLPIPSGIKNRIKSTLGLKAEDNLPERTVERLQELESRSTNRFFGRLSGDEEVELEELRGRLAAGRLDTGKLQETNENTESLISVDSNSPRRRGLTNEQKEKLRETRERNVARRLALDDADKIQPMLRNDADAINQNSLDVQTTERAAAQASANLLSELSSTTVNNANVNNNTIMSVPAQDRTERALYSFA